MIYIIRKTFILFCEITENRFQLMHDRYGLNLRKCNSASSLSGSIEPDLSKVIIALQTINEIVDIFEQTLTGRFSCANTRLAFDTEIRLPNAPAKADGVLSKDLNYKVCYRLKLDEDENYATRRVISKTLKLDENNQYGYAMTEPLPTGCIKKEPQPTWKTFDILLQKVDLDDPVGHLFVVDISFDYEKATPRLRTYNKIYPSIIVKQKIIDICERSVYQLIEQYNETDKGKPRSYCATKKAHAALFEKKFQPLCLEHLEFLN